MPVWFVCITKGKCQSDTVTNFLNISYDFQIHRVRLLRRKNEAESLYKFRKILKSLPSKESFVNDRSQCLNGKGAAFLRSSPAADAQLTRPAQDQGWGRGQAQAGAGPRVPPGGWREPTTQGSIISLDVAVRSEWTHRDFSPVHHHVCCLPCTPEYTVSIHQKWRSPYIWVSHRKLSEFKK